MCLLWKEGLQDGLLGKGVLDLRHRSQKAAVFKVVKKREKMIINLPENVERVIERLEENGFEGFVVGGCVRDSLLKKTPTDWDITTDALPEEMKKIFKKTFDTGIDHGTVTVLMGGIGYELTTYRIDGAYSDGRHPDTVSFSRNLSEDLCRRDFTINAMAYSHKRGIVDLYNGKEDLDEGIIRAVGDAKKRFDEDALRMLRAVRFSSQLGFKIEDKTFDAIKEKAALLSKVSKERIFVELNKTLCGEYAENINLIYKSGLYRYIGKEFGKLKEEFYDFYSRKFGDQKYMYWTAFLQNIDDISLVKRIFSELKSDNVTKNNTCLLIEELKLPLPSDDEDIRWSLNRLGYRLFEDYIKICKSDRKKKEALQKIYDIENRYESIKRENQAFEISMLDVTGSDLIRLGMQKGPEIGEMLEHLLKRVIKNPEQNKKELLTSYVFSLFH